MDWRRVMSWLIVAFIVWAGLDLWEGLSYLTMAPGVNDSHALAGLWLVPIVLLVGATRAGRSAEEAMVASASPGRPAVGANAILLLLPAVPGIHFAMYWAGWLDEASRPYRELWVMTTLVAFAVIGIWYQRGLESILERMAAESARTKEGLARSHRLEVVSRLSAGVAHDFNNMLTIILNSAELLRAPGPKTEAVVSEEAGEISRASRRGAEMVQRLLSFGAGRNLQVVPLDLRTLVDRMVPTLRRFIPASIMIEWSQPLESMVCHADRTAVEEILINLATNGRDAMTDGGRLTISLERTGPGVVALAVADTGIGMSAETRAHLFEPYFTTKAQSGGTGLGLAMAYGLTHQMGGKIDVRSGIDEGTTVRIVLRAADGVPQATDPAIPVVGVEGVTVLLVEDDEAVRRITERVLVKAGYRVLTASDGRAGLELLRARPNDIGLVLTDVTMPVLGGIELYRASRGAYHGPFVFMSGYAEAKPVASGGEELPLVSKPFTPDALLSAVARHLQTERA